MTLKLGSPMDSAGPPPPLALPLSYYDFNYRQRATTHSIEVYLSTNIELEKLQSEAKCEILSVYKYT